MTKPRDTSTNRLGFLPSGYAIPVAAPLLAGAVVVATGWRIDGGGRGLFSAWSKIKAAIFAKTPLGKLNRSVGALLSTATSPRVAVTGQMMLKESN